MKRLFYDCEIVKCIPNQWEDNLPNYEYCDGWHDFPNMGISVIGTFVEWENIYLHFVDSELDIFQKIVNDADEIIGFNSLSFNDNLCAANNIKISTTIDLLCKVRIAAGMLPYYEKGITTGGYSLGALASVNLNLEKTGTGELAPMLWQDGRKYEVIKYCLNDVKLLVELEKLDYLIDPTDQEIKLKMK
jgi:hypothetical protein